VGAFISIYGRFLFHDAGHRRACLVLIAVALAPVEAVAPLPADNGALLQPEVMNPFVDAFNAYVPAVPPDDPYKAMDPYNLVPAPTPSAEPSEPCDGKEEGNDCKDEVALGGKAGYCKADAESDNGLACHAKGVCEPASKDDPCTDPAAGIMSGICESDSNGGLVCHQKLPCKGKATGDSCEDPPYVTDGHCKEIKYGGDKPAGSPTHYCQQKSPCFGKDDGEDCTMVRQQPDGPVRRQPDYDYCTPKSPVHRRQPRRSVLRLLLEAQPRHQEDGEKFHRRRRVRRSRRVPWPS
jgi:hypothetical protein